MLDGNLLALGFILMSIVIVIVAWAYCVRRSKRADQDLHAALVGDEDGDSSGYVAVGMIAAHDRANPLVNDTYAGTEMHVMQSSQKRAPGVEESSLVDIKPAPWGDRWAAPLTPSIYDSTPQKERDSINGVDALVDDASNAAADSSGA